jgi:hypothetical protein
MSYNSQQLQFGIGFTPQSNLVTPNKAAEIWRVGKSNAGFSKFGLTTESNAADIGKGSEFATQVFPVSWDVSGSIEKILSSEMAAWAFIFGLGTANATYANGLYTVHETDACDGLDLPSFTVVEQLGAGCPGGAGLDRAGFGCVIGDFAIKFSNGPGRNNSMITANFAGCGANAQPSAIVLPAALVEHELRGGSATVSINGVDYVSDKSLLSLDMGFANNLRLDQGFFIGSGVQDGAALRGRMERGNRAYSLSFVARLSAGSTEYTKLKSLIPGPATITLTNSTTESLSVTYHKVQFSSVDVADDNGIVTVQVGCTILEDATDGVVTAVIKTAKTGIGGLA